MEEIALFSKQGLQFLFAYGQTSEYFEQITPIERWVIRKLKAFLRTRFVPSRPLNTIRARFCYVG